MLLCPSSPTAFWRVALAAAVALWLHGVLSREARASCGDWLADPTMPAQAAHEPGDQAPAPCRHGECRQAPTPPLPSPPPPTVQRDLERWCHPGGMSLCLLSESSRLCWLETILLPEGCPTRIERPPRS